MHLGGLFFYFINIVEKQILPLHKQTTTKKELKTTRAGKELHICTTHEAKKWR